jgi:HD-GYP domain-containing protein (c-di-GMP phosphodiesterase class II)
MADPLQLSRLIAQYIHNQFKIDHIGILLKDTHKNCYTFRVSQGSEKIPVGLVKMDASSTFVKWFTYDGIHRREGAQILTFHKLRIWLENPKWMNENPERAELVKGLSREMHRFHASVIAPSFYKNELMAILLLGAKNSHTAYVMEDLSLLSTLCNDVAMTVHNAWLFSNLNETNKKLKNRIHEVEILRSQEHMNMRQVVHSLAEAVCAKDQYTGGHINDVARIGMLLGERVFEAKGIELTAHRRDLLLTVLRLHDLGKVGTPDSILKKQSKLTPDEWTIMRNHANIGAQILSPLDYFRESAHAIQHHHENWDGSGYPHGLKGEEIPLEARIVSIVDAYHAMTSNRSYHKGISDEKAIEHIREAAGDQFDPFIADIFIKLLEEGKIMAA